MRSDVIRFKELPHKPFGDCEECGKRAARYFAIETLCKSDMAAFLCRQCVPSSAVEIDPDHDIFALTKPATA